MPRGFPVIAAFLSRIPAHEKRARRYPDQFQGHIARKHDGCFVPGFVFTFLLPLTFLFALAGFSLLHGFPFHNHFLFGPHRVGISTLNERIARMPGHGPIPQGWGQTVVGSGQVGPEPDGAHRNAADVHTAVHIPVTADGYAACFGQNVHSKGCGRWYSSIKRKPVPGVETRRRNGRGHHGSHIRILPCRSGQAERIPDSRRIPIATIDLRAGISVFRRSAYVASEGRRGRGIPNVKVKGSPAVNTD
ncbi:MAG: hypothetical protein BWY09_00767 [Candidatus Hydrogenedentes bacterium ADurb.Bin179]|nr:MAG: hypothetical protein BWY09_00767 [Candidatus Hydrogenedentes bacterium ADurb.Bin179]